MAPAEHKTFKINNETNNDKIMQCDNMQLVDFTPNKLESSMKHFQNEMYDDGTTSSYAEQCLDSAASTCTETSAGNASLSTLEVYQLEAETTAYNYRGPKVVIKNETPATICTANTIGHL